MQTVALIAIVVGAILALVPFLEAIGMPIVRGSPSPETMVRGGGVLVVAGIVDLVLALFGWGGPAGWATWIVGVVGLSFVGLALVGTMADPLGSRGPWDLFPWPYGVGLSLIVAAAVSAVFG
mgnify:CR=1 FL=1